MTREVERLDEALARLAVQSALLPNHAYAMARDELLGQREDAAERLLTAQNDAAALARPAPVLARSVLASWDELVEDDPQGLRDVLAALISRVEIVRREGKWARVRVVPRWEVRPR